MSTRFLSLGSALAICALITSLGHRANAMSIDPATWQELVFTSDLVAVVECTIAGGIVAEYKCVEVFKGDPALGDTVRIRIHPDPYGDYFPAALVGERLLVAGSRPIWTRPYDPFEHSLFVTMANPLGARILRYDYQLPIYQGLVRLPVPAGQHVGFGRYEGDSVAAFMAEVREFLASPTIELLVLQSQVDKYVFEEANPIERRQPRFVALEAAGNADGTVEEYADAIIAFARAAFPSFRDRAVQALERSVSPAVARHILAMAPDSLPVEPSRRERFLERMQEILEPRSWDPGRGLMPTPEQLRAAQEALTQTNAPAEELMKAANFLLKTETDAVVRALKHWENPEKKERHLRDAGYVIGSYFTIYCPTDRAKRFRELLDAKDEWIRVAAATYLTFEDEAEGKKQLRRFTSLESDAGAWAAVNLMRRGDEEPMVQMLRWYGQALTPGPHFGPYRMQLARRFEVLISNSAAASDVPQPSLPPYADRYGQAIEKVRAAYATWWRDYGASVTLRDPWLTELAPQKVD